MRASVMEDEDVWRVDAELVSPKDCVDRGSAGLALDATRCERSVVDGVNSGLLGAKDGCVVVKPGSVTGGEFAKACIVMSKLSKEYGDAEKSQAGRSSSNGRVEFAK